MFEQGWFLTHEKTAPVERVVAIAHEIENGFFYPRWLSLSYYGLGSPFHNFYPPGFHLASAYLHLAGFSAIASIKIMGAFFFYLGGAGMFLWMRRHYGFYGSFLSAVLYMFAPYHLVDLYVRGAFAEFAAIGLAPSLFLGMDMAFSEKWLKGLALTAGATAGLILFHTLSAVMIAPCAAVYFVYLALGSRPAAILRAAAAPLIGAGASAFYWLPVMKEVSYLREFEEAVLGDQFYFAYHFVDFNQLYSLMWDYGFSLPGPNDGMSFQIGLAILAFAFIAAALLVFSKGKRVFPAVLLALGLLAVFLTTEPSSRIYETIRPLQYIQFPWRFLGPATLFLAAFAGLGLNTIDSWSKGPTRFLPALILAAAIILVIALSGHQRAVLPDTSDIGKRNIGSLCVRDEYLPKGVYSSPEVLEFLGLYENKVSANGAEIANVQVAGSKVDFEYRAQGPAMATVTTFFFPGWKVRLGDKEIAAGADDKGLITFPLPAGSGRVSVIFENTPVRYAGWLISAFTVVAFLLAAALWRKKSGAPR